MNTDDGSIYGDGRFKGGFDGNEYVEALLMMEVEMGSTNILIKMELIKWGAYDVDENLMYMDTLMEVL